MRLRVRGRRMALLLLGMTGMLIAGGCSTSERECEPCYWECRRIYPPSNEGEVTITQGVWGDVWFWQGIFFPGTCPPGTIRAVAREMRVHELTHLDQVDFAPDGFPFYTAIHTQLVATVYSDSSGFFQVELPPGQYSLFVVEDTLFYANFFSVDGNIFPVTVKEGRVAHRRFDITYKAAF